MGERLRRFGMILAAVLVLLTGAPPSALASGDVITNLDASFDVHQDGTMSVRYRVDVTLASPHGLLFGIRVREAWQGDQDAIYKVSDVQVSSPTGAPDHVVRTEKTSGHNRMLYLRIGDPDVTLADRHQTYEISYTVAGALRTVAGGPQLNWDVTSSDVPSIEQATITVTGPAAVTRARCAEVAKDCTSSLTGGTARYRAHDLRANQPLTVVAQFPEGSIEHAEPILRHNFVADLYEMLPTILGCIGVVVAMVLLGMLVGTLRLVPDQRPGLRSAGGAPVSFAVPEVDLATAGLVLDRHYRKRHAAAMLTQLAVIGRVQLSLDEKKRKGRTVLQAVRTSATPRQLNRLDPIEARTLTTVPEQGTFSSYWANDFRTAIQQHQKDAISAGTWTRPPSRLQAMVRSLVIWVPALAGVLVGLWLRFFGKAEDPMASLILGWPLVIGGALYGFAASETLPWGLNRAGSELRERLLGFKTYLGRAEANQLRHDAATEHYTRLLPWAVLFGQTAHWQRVCNELVQSGDLDPSGLSSWPSGMDASSLGSSLDQTFAPSRSSDSSAGGGTGSGFSGGGGGSGGGGASMSSW